MFSEWLTDLAIIWIIISVIAAVIIFIDIKFYRPQSMKIMMFAWPINALYFGLISFIFYFWFGRAKKDQKMDMDMSMHMGMNPSMHMNMDMSHMDHMHMKKPITWKNMFKIGTHCGSGCTLADIIGEFFVLICPVAIAGSLVYGSWLVAFILALIIGIYFQYLPNREMGLPKFTALKKAIQADVLSVISWQIGMYIWMALVFFVFFSPDMSRFSFVYWFMMQIAMIAGFFTALPINFILAKKGIKHIM